ncbi:hypothetical protein Tco_0373248 [Tanacetum coccineum]
MFLAIMAFKEELMVFRRSVIEPVTQEFIPLNKGCDHDEVWKVKSDIGDKKNWLIFLLNNVINWCDHDEVLHQHIWIWEIVIRYGIMARKMIGAEDNRDTLKGQFELEQLRKDFNKLNKEVAKLRLITWMKHLTNAVARNSLAEAYRKMKAIAT